MTFGRVAGHNKTRMFVELVLQQVRKRPADNALETDKVPSPSCLAVIRIRAPVGTNTSCIC